MTEQEKRPAGGDPGAAQSGGGAGRVSGFAHAADLGAVAAVLEAQRDGILERWLDAAAGEPFHLGRREHAVADHIPRLFDALVALLARAAPRAVDAIAPLEDPTLVAAAQDHGRARYEQGLTAADVVIEFRLLRQEIGRTLRTHLPRAERAVDVVAAELLVHDALDGAILVALATLDEGEAERRQLYEETGRARAAAEEAVQLRDRVLAAVTHDLRTPLTAIRGYTQLLQRQVGRIDLPAVRAMAPALGHIEAMTRTMARWIDELGDVARLQAGQELPLDRRTVDVVALAHRVAEDQAESDRARLRIEAALPSLTGEWDEARLERVLHNLVGNALKFSPASREVTLTIELAEGNGGTGPERARGGDAAGITGQWAVVRVRDEGIGIPKDALPRVFERFYRAENAAGRYDGSGIGLATSRQTVEQHGGTIQVESEEGKGSTVTVRLPLAPPPGSTPAGGGSTVQD